MKSFNFCRSTVLEYLQSFSSFGYSSLLDSALKNFVYVPDRKTYCFSFTAMLTKACQEIFFFFFVNRKTLRKTWKDLVSTGFKKPGSTFLWWWWWFVFGKWLSDERCLRLISRWKHCQRFSPSQISDTPRAGFEPARNLSSDFVEGSCAVVIRNKKNQHHKQHPKKLQIFL